MSEPTRPSLTEMLAGMTDPEILANQRRFLQAMLDARPDWKQELLGEELQKRIQLGRLAQARDLVRVVLAARGIALRPADEERVDGCEDLPTLRNWRLQALTASTVEEALR